MSKEFTVRTFGNDQALVKECGNYMVGCPTYVKEQIDAIFRPIRVDNNWRW